jgi:hypothetical protein
VSLRS